MHWAKRPRQVCLSLGPECTLSYQWPSFLVILAAGASLPSSSWGHPFFVIVTMTAALPDGHRDAGFPPLSSYGGGVPSLVVVVIGASPPCGRHDGGCPPLSSSRCGLPCLVIVVVRASLPCGRRDGGYPPLWSAGHRLYILWEAALMHVLLESICIESRRQIQVVNHTTPHNPCTIPNQQG